MDLSLQHGFDGLANGAIYGSMAVALSMVSRRSGILNLAQGQLAMIGASLTALLVTPPIAGMFGSGLASAVGAPLPVWLAIGIAAAVTATLGVAMERFVIRPLEPSDLVLITGATMAVFLGLNAVVRQQWGQTFQVDSPFPERWHTIGVVVALTALVGLSALVGRAPRPLGSGGVWALAAALGSVAAGLSGTLTGVSPAMMVRVLVMASAALVVGGLARPGGALAAGLAIGVAESVLIDSFDAITPDLAVVLASGVLALALSIRPEGLAAGRQPIGFARGEHRSGFRLSFRFRAVGWLALGVAAMVAPSVADPSLLASLTRGVILAIALLGLQVALINGGVVSLGQGAMLGAGAWTAGVLVSDFGLAIGPAIGVTAVVVGAAGVVVGLPALRAGPLGLVLMTLALAASFPLALPRVVGPFGQIHELGEPPALTVAVVVAVAADAALLFVLRGRSGCSPLAAFALSAGLAGAAGAVLLIESPNVHGPDFPVQLSIRLFAVGLLVGGHRLGGAIVGGLFLVLLPRALSVVGLGGFEDLVLALALLWVVVVLQGRGAGASVYSWPNGGRLGRRPGCRSDEQF